MRLIEVATQEFARLGYDGARVEKIARRAKVNKQLVYHYFGSKDALYAAVIQQAYLQFRGDEDIMLRVANEKNPETALKNLARYLYSRDSRVVGFQQLLQDLNRKKNNRHLKALLGVREAYDRLIETVGAILNKGAQQGRFRSGIDPREFYISLAGIYSVRINNAATLSYMLGADLTSEAGATKSFDYAFSLLLDGIRTTAIRADPGSLDSC